MSIKPESSLWLVGRYLKDRLKILLAFGLFILLFFLVYLLYNLPWEAALYGALLCLCAGTVFGAYDLYQYVQKHQKLSLLRQAVAYGLEQLPEPQSLAELDYRELLEHLYQDKTALISKQDRQFSDMLSYYTMWAHQIKTPIAAMRLLLQTESRSSAGQLEQELFKIEQYVEMVLHYLRMESMSADLLLKEVPLYPLVSQCVKKYSILFIQKKIRLQMEPFSLTALTDEKWLSFVIEQLLSNALKYTDAGGSVAVYPHPNKPRALVIEDTGIGIKAEDIPRIFERGFTGYNGRMDKKSTGIGLFLCRQITSRLGHDIEIQSQVGRCTRVTLDLNREELSPE